MIVTWLYFENIPIDMDVGEGTSGASVDVPLFGLEIHSVSSAIVDKEVFGKKICDIKELSLPAY